MPENHPFAGMSDDEYDGKSMEERVAYLRTRQKFVTYVIGFIMGKPPDGRDLDWPLVEELKEIVEYGRNEIAARKALQHKQADIRQRRWAMTGRLATSAGLGIAGYILTQVAAPLGVWLSQLLPFHGVVK